MRYKNTKTGAIIDSSCVISGGDWIKVEPVEAPRPEIEKPAPKRKAQPAKKRR